MIIDTSGFTTNARRVPAEHPLRARGQEGGSMNETAQIFDARTQLFDARRTPAWTYMVVSAAALTVLLAFAVLRPAVTYLPISSDRAHVYGTLPVDVIDLLRAHGRTVTMGPRP